MDMCGFPKDNYYYHQAWWKTAPILHILPHWNWPGREDQAIKVIVFGNTEKVELFQDGQSLGVKDMPRNEHLEWEVKYRPGVLEAKGYNGSAPSVALATDRVETTGAPATLRLVVDRTALTADGEDMIPVEVDVLDAQGRIVPTANDLVKFTVRPALASSPAWGMAIRAIMTPTRRIIAMPSTANASLLWAPGIAPERSPCKPRPMV